MVSATSRNVRAHEDYYVRRVEELSRGVGVDDAADYGLGTPDNPVFPGMDEAARWHVGGTLHAARLLPGGHATAHHPIAALDPAARRRAFEAAHQREACGLEYRRRQPCLEDVRVLGIHVGGDADALEQHGADLGRAQTGDVRGELVEDLVHHVVRLHVPAGGDQGPLDPERPGGFRLLARGQGGRGGQFALRLRRRRGRLREQEREREHHRAPPESNQS